MTNSVKKNATLSAAAATSRAERVLLDRSNQQQPTARASSHKKLSSGSASARGSGNASSSTSSKKKKVQKKAAWDDTIQDLSVHKLAKAQLQAKHDLMKRAVREHSRERAGRAELPRAEIMSPPTAQQRAQHQRTDSHSSGTARGRSRSPAAFTSPASDASAASSAASTPDSQHMDSDSGVSSEASTPSPQENARRRPAQPQQAILSARPQVPRQVRAVKKEAAPVSTLPPAPMTRVVAAPVMTSAPVSLDSSFSEEEHDNSFSAFAPAPGSLPSAPITNYSPWLKPNNVLSPVLERSMVDSAASTPSAPGPQHLQHQPTQKMEQALDRPFITDQSSAPSLASSPLRSAMAAAPRRSEQADEQGSGRNLLDELRQSIDAPAAAPDVPSAVTGSTLANLPLPMQHHFMSLLRQVVTHLSERDRVSSQEAQFKANTVASISGCNAQLKQMSLRIEQVEREKLELVEQTQSYQREMQAMQLRLSMLEQRMEMMNGGRPMQQLVPQLQQLQQVPTRPVQLPQQLQPQQSSAYDPSLYHSQHPSKSTLPAQSLFHSSNYNGNNNNNNNNTATAPAASAAPLVRAPSPPRPIVINHATQSAAVQQAQHARSRRDRSATALKSTIRSER